MSIVTTEELAAIESRLKRGDMLKVAYKLNINKGIVSQVITNKAIWLQKAYPVYVAAKEMLDTRDQIASRQIKPKEEVDAD